MVHVDEKWFYMSETTTNYYIVPNELPPDMRCKHKSHIEKVMFAAAVAQPMYDGTKER
jgi:hypothetical protein